VRTFYDCSAKLEASKNWDLELCAERAAVRLPEVSAARPLRVLPVEGRFGFHPTFMM
jgi:hypothetical protein